MEKTFFEKEKAKKFSKATFIFGYVFLAITITAAVIATVYWIKDARKNDLADVLIMLLFAAFIAFVIYLAFSITYSALLLVKAKKIDPTINKKAKQLDLAFAIINLIIAAVVMSWMILGSIYSDSVSDLTYIVYAVCFDVAFIITLASVIYNTIQYKKVFLGSKPKTAIKK